MCELADEAFEGDAVLEGDTGGGAEGVHEPADGGAFLGHGDEEFTGHVVFVEADGEVAFVAGDVELVSE